MIRNDQLRACVFLTVATLCWGLNANFAKLAVGEISPMQVVTFRWLGVVLILLVFARDNIQRDWPIQPPPVPRQDHILPDDQVFVRGSQRVAIE